LQEDGMTDLQFHELADIFPLMTGDDFDQLVEDIRKNGLHEPVGLLDGKILDGRNRYRACLLAGVECRTEEIETDDPIAYVLSLNRHRRHQTPSKLASAGAKAEKLYEKFKAEAEKRQHEAGIHGVKGGRGHKATNPSGTNTGRVSSDTRDKIGAMVGVSGSMIDRARKLREKGVPELAKAVEEGRISVTSAAKLTEEEPEVQRQVAADAKFSRGRFRNAKPAKGDVGCPIKNYDRTEQFAIECARCAITQLEPIRPDNPGREKAYTKVEKWISSQRKKA
jgi:hypothetical protein